MKDCKHDFQDKYALDNWQKRDSYGRGMTVIQMLQQCKKCKEIKVESMESLN